VFLMIPNKCVLLKKVMAPTYICRLAHIPLPNRAS
jgi:hypothetical protein